MAITKKPYELSVWSESLKDNGQKEESRIFIIGAHDMTYLGRATALKLKTKINGTHELTFQIPTKFFDSEVGDYVYNKFIDEIFAERKIKLHYKNKWYEFFVKTVKENKKLKSLLKTFTCTDSFIDELSRNGYGITFDEELYNNVEEIGTFTEEILEDSLWYYEPKNNWGDFTEYIEDKLFKIPINQFNKIQGYKLNFTTDSDTKIANAFTGEERPLEMGDDQARAEKIFWDQKGTKGNTKNKLTATAISGIENDGYIYVPYSCLDFCYYQSEDTQDNVYDVAATEIPYELNGNYAVAPPSVDPNYLIQFYAMPAGATIKIDEAGLIVDKDYIYFMTLKQWNEFISGDKWYIFEEKETKTIENISYIRTVKKIVENPTNRQMSMGNKVAFYDGYLTEWNSTNIVKGKKIQISDRTEVNISEEIDQYTTVYNNFADEYKGLYTNEDWSFNSSTDSNYRVCSKLATRQIVPQLARNFVQNGTDIKSTDGWDVMGLVSTDSHLNSAKIKNNTLYSGTEVNVLNEPVAETGFIYYTPPRYEAATIWKTFEEDTNKNKIYKFPYYYQKGDTIYRLENESDTEVVFLEKASVKDFKKQNPKVEATDDKYYCQPIDKKIIVIYGRTNSSLSTTIELNPIKNTSQYSVVNFGAVAQEKRLEKGKVYCLGWAMCIEDNTNITHSKNSIQIGEGSLISSNEYSFTQENNVINIPLENLGLKLIPSSIFSALDKGEKIQNDSVNKFFFINYLFIKPTKTIKNPYIAIKSMSSFMISNLQLFEAYTKGKDQFANGTYQYSGREYMQTNLTPIRNENEDIVAYISGIRNKFSIQNEILFEDDVMPGDTYGYQQYYIQRLYTKGKNKGYDTMGINEFTSSDPNKLKDNLLPLDAAYYNEEDYEIQTNYIDLNSCEYYNQTATFNAKECSHQASNGVCMYQMYGYCPYRFYTEKHCRKIRTLKGEKSNRFNLTQELSKVFECYPMYYIEHDNNGYVKTKNDGTVDKRIFFITEKGNENLHGFRYHKNLSDIERTIKSDKIVTKLYVQDVDSDISRTGLCSIKTAEDNPTKDSFIIDFSYYTTKGMLDKEKTEKDLYDNYLKKLGFYNSEYDKLSNKIISLQDSSFTELEANLNVNLDAIETALQQMHKYEVQIDKYTAAINSTDNSKGKTSAIDNYKIKYAEQEQILNQLIVDTFQTNGEYADGDSNTPPAIWITEHPLNTIREDWVENHTYSNGILGQYNKEFLQIQMWKKDRASYLKQINTISSAFFKKYEPYLKEGTWSDSNYLTDNAYYHGALEVAAEGAIPNVSYSIKVIDISPLPEFKDWEIDVADTSFIEDEELFGFDKKSGLPNKFKILVSELNESLDEPSKNSITIQNFTTQFEDLFKQVTASVQSLQFNQNIYKRSSNFTSLHNVEESSFQGTLDSNKFTLLSTSENNIQLDATGQKGSDINNHANQYSLDGQGLQFSNNGGQSWNTGVGPSGINADYIKVGTLDAGKIRITDSGYIYFAWDKDGIAAYRNPESSTTDSNNINDYALFNKFGLSLVKDGKIKLRSGYDFNGTEGLMSTENEVGSNIGFYLYDNSGNMLFETSTDDERSAKLRLRGEIYATDSDLQDNITKDGAIAVYLNNQSEHGNPQNKEVDGLRLFTAAYVNEDKIKNVFSVLRNGAYIGGTIYKQNTQSESSLSGSQISELPDSIYISNPGIVFNSENGSIQIDFDRLTNTQDGQSLVNYVGSKNYKVQLFEDYPFSTEGAWGDDSYSDLTHTYLNYTSSSASLSALISDHNDLVSKVADLYRYLNKGSLVTSPDVKV